MILRDSVMSCPSSSIAGSSPPRTYETADGGQALERQDKLVWCRVAQSDHQSDRLTLDRNQSGLSPYERMLIFSTRYGMRFSSSSSHTFWQ